MLENIMEKPTSSPVYLKLLKPHKNVGVELEEVNVKANSLYPLPEPSLL
jgi:hypothetical protein